MEHQKIVSLVSSSTHVSKCNVRSSRNVHGLKELATLIKAQGQIQPVVYRMEDGKPGILVGQRRRGSCLLIEKENPDFKLLGIEVDVDDAQARAISLTENVGREAMTEVDEWKSLSSLVKQGWTVESISQVYSIPEKKVKQLIALGECLVGVLAAFDKEDIELDGLRLLAIAPKAKVREWLKLYRSGEQYPRWRHHIQSFLFNSNTTYSTSVALFDVAESGLATIEDMFKDSVIFADSETFLEHQQVAVNIEIERLKELGWADVVIDDNFYKYDYVKCKKTDGGKIFVERENDGSVTFHNAYLSRKEHQKNQAASTKTEKGCSVDDLADEKPEITNTMREYLLMYLTQASRTSVQQNPVLAKQVLITLLLVQSDDFSFSTYSGDTSFDRVSEANDDEIKKTKAFIDYDAFRRDMLKTIKVSANWKQASTSFDSAFKKIAKLDPKKLDTVLAVLTADLLTVFGCASLPVIKHAKPNMANFWSAEQGGVFFEKIRNKKALFEIMESATNKETVTQNETLKVSQIRENLKTMTEKVKGWVPKYLSGGWYDTGKGTPFKK